MLVEIECITIAQNEATTEVVAVGGKQGRDKAAL